MLGLNSTSEFPQKAADSMSDDKHSGRLRYVQLLKVTAALNMATTLDVVHHLQYLETVSETGSVDLVVSKLPVVATILDIVHHLQYLETVSETGSVCVIKSKAYQKDLVECPIYLSCSLIRRCQKPI